MPFSFAHRIVGRALCLGSSRFAHLRRYENSGSGEDLADCVAGILTETPNPVSKLDQVTVEEIDALLNGLAANCRFSSHSVRQSYWNTGCENKETLGELYRQVHAREAKWLTRIILKQIQLTALDPSIVYGSYDARLPFVARVQESFEVALTSLRELRASNPLGIGTQNLVHVIKPILGTKVGRQTWLKGRSIKHCIGLHPKRISCEKKMDGEYCQVHVDLSKGSRSVQIFSKSGKDSTQDRVGIHKAIRDSLGVGGSKPKISQGCVLEGELLVYNEREGRILPFHKIRKYVLRSGVLLGTQKDSPSDPDEHLMIVYFDVLLIDNEQVIDLSLRQGASDLRRALAESITHREEGLVLKPDDPYFDFSKDKRSFAGCPIKLKKEYIGNFGDVGDFAVIGARYDPVKAKEYNIPGLKWTHFYYGCLTNKGDVQRHQSKPKFMVIDTVEQGDCFISDPCVFNFIGHRCKMRNREILLAPCIANQLLVTESILPAHGIKSWVTDPGNWRQSELSHVRDGATLGELYRQVHAREAKWLTRIVLKQTQLTALDPSIVYGSYDARLPFVARVQESFEVALTSLRELRASNPLGIGTQNLVHVIKPILGTKVGRQTWLKGRSIKHCIGLHPKRVSCEKKMDGEYCQVHVDLSKGSRSVQIFSKSGKDSTQDRVGIHKAIRDSLGIGGSKPKISQGCVLEGELLVYNEREGRILPFHKIRKYVLRSGVPLGTQKDSPPDLDEHLMIVYFDVLLIDNESLLGVIDLSLRQGASDLRRAFAESITHREEGLVLKPDDPYFDFSKDKRSFAGCPIKLKKEYIGNFGDVGDFAVIGARYDPVKAQEYNVPGLKWTHFYYGCLTNKEDVQRHQTKPKFMVVDTVETTVQNIPTLEHCVS
ncbi:DNA ligase 4 like protein [Verticillium longisporum]|nr:DNA ligase 4 like protein [Verticillium longisporum]